MSRRAVFIAAPLILSLIAACATRTPSNHPVASLATTKPAVVYVTGSRIPVSVSSSNGHAQGAQPVQTVGQQDISLTGQTNPANALRMLTPALGQ